MSTTGGDLQIPSIRTTLTRWSVDRHYGAFEYNTRAPDGGCKFRKRTVPRMRPKPMTLYQNENISFLYVNISDYYPRRSITSGVRVRADTNNKTVVRTRMG